jgi:RimJ/RimL family protein N-acetyltransferase
MPIIDAPITLEIVRFPDETPAHISSAHEGTIDENDLRRIVQICSEPEVYANLFRRMLAGLAYSTSNAIGFRDFCYAGWAERRSFVFLIRDADKRLVGVMDIKSPEHGAEIGFWVSNTAPGYMTNAVKTLLQIATEAGYQSLSAWTLASNIRSQRLLGRVGFERTRAETKEGIDFVFFQRSLR